MSGRGVLADPLDETNLNPALCTRLHWMQNLSPVQVMLGFTAQFR
jgi:hypothetical protein